MNLQMKYNMLSTRKDILVHDKVGKVLKYETGWEHETLLIG